jgi:hypothetical protein
MNMTAWLGIHLDGNVVLVATVTAFATSLVTVVIKERARLAVEIRLHRNKADANYEYEQRKKLRDTIGAYRGQLVEAATDFNYRLANLDISIGKGWLKQDGPTGDTYYFQTTVYRFLILASVSNRFEREALVIDSQIADKDDLAFLLYVKAFRWGLTDAALFKGVADYRESDPTSHLLTDRLRQMCAVVYVDDRELSFGEFEHRLLQQTAPTGVEAALSFFDGLERGDQRWDRLWVFRLLLLAFINTFGYEMQHSTQEHLDEVASNVDRDRVLENFRSWIDKLGLGKEEEMANVRSAIDRRLAASA